MAMLFEFQPHSGGLALILVGVVSIALAAFANVVYQRFLSPLAKYPGPFFASLTGAWFAVQSRRPDFHRLVINLHQEYGPVVRVKPNKLSIASPEAFKIIYGAGKNFVKGDMYEIFKGKRTWDIFAERDERIHGQQRRLVSRAYSMDTMKSLEPYVTSTIKVFLNKFAEATAKGQAVDFSYLIQLFAFDVIGEVTFARRFGYVDALSDFNLFALLISVFRCGAWICEVPWLYHLHQRLMPLIGNHLAFNLRNTSLVDFTKKEIAARKDRMGASGDHGGDILSKLLAVQREKPELKESDIGFMLTSNVTAGSDTTSVSLCSIVYRLLTTPAALDRLLRELREKVESGEIDEDGVVTQKQAESWPYLQAIIYEGLRLHPATGGLLPRVVPKEGLRFEDYFIPGGYEVGTSPWVIHREKSIFGEDVEDFRPERWLDEERKHDMHRFFFSFGGGSRTCIGKNISLLEMGKILPTLFLHFDLRLATSEKPQEYYGVLVHLKPLFIIARRRSILETQ